MSIRNCLVISVPVCAVIVALIWFRKKKFKEKFENSKDKTNMSNSDETKVTESKKMFEDTVSPDVNSKSMENQNPSNDQTNVKSVDPVEESSTKKAEEQILDDHNKFELEMEEINLPVVRSVNENDIESEDSLKPRTSSRSSWAEEVEKSEQVENRIAQELTTYPEAANETENALLNETKSVSISAPEKESLLSFPSDKKSAEETIAQVQNKEPSDTSHVKIYRKNATSSPEFISPMKQKAKAKKSKRVNFQLQKNSVNKRVNEHNDQHLNDTKAPRKQKKAILKTKSNPSVKTEESSISGSAPTNEPTSVSDSQAAVANRSDEHCSSNDEAECSNDSGNGASGSDGDFKTLVAGEMTTVDGEPVRRHTINFPSELVGLLIGRSGKNVDTIVSKTGVQLSMKPKVFDKDHQLCILKGSNAAVEKALNILKKRFREVDLSDIDQTQDGPVFNWIDLHINLTEGKHDVVVSSVYSPCEFFIQLSRHPSYCDFRRLIDYMKIVYTDVNTTIPQLPRPVRPNIVCAAPLNNGWYRAIVRKYYPKEDECEVKYVDYGGYQRVSCYTLRQLRIDFLSLPFQAIKCRLAGIKVNPGAPDDVVQRVESMLHAQKMVASVRGFANDEPLVDLYIPVGDMDLHINNILVQQGLALPDRSQDFDDAKSENSDGEDIEIERETENKNTEEITTSSDFKEDVKA